ncbi:hypothetical protein D9M72_614460 [compost metagenome]
MRSDCSDDFLRGILAALKCRGRDDAANDDTGIHMPGLRLQADLNSDVVFAGLVEQGVELAKCLGGVRIGRLQKDLEEMWTGAPGEWIGVPS